MVVARVGSAHLARTVDGEETVQLSETSAHVLELALGASRRRAVAAMAADVLGLSRSEALEAVRGASAELSLLGLERTPLLDA